MSGVNCWIFTPIQPGRSQPYCIRRVITSRALCEGIAKPTPLDASVGDTIAVLIPTTLPFASTKGPPELPWLIAASV